MIPVGSLRAAKAIFHKGRTYEIEFVENPCGPPSVHRRLGRQNHHGQ
jgi:hypothetical protein